MGNIKKKWFLALNVVIVLATLVVFFLGVMGSSSKEEVLAKKIETGCRNLEGLASKKPTKEWYEVLESNIRNLDSERKSILEPLATSDNLIDRYFDLNNREIIVSTPIEGRFPEFKEMMQEKWSAISKKFCSESSPFSCKAELLTSLEPNWLRTAVTPSKVSDVNESMKRYWISLEVLEILQRAEIFALDKFSLGQLFEDPSYANGGKTFWAVRNLELVIHLESKKVNNLLKMFHESPLLFRVVGISIKNEFSAPSGITSNADYVVFDGIERQALTLALQHFDYIQEGEELVLESNISPGVQMNTMGSGRR